MLWKNFVPGTASGDECAAPVNPETFPKLTRLLIQFRLGQGPDRRRRGLERRRGRRHPVQRGARVRNPGDDTRFTGG